MNRELSTPDAERRQTLEDAAKMCDERAARWRNEAAMPGKPPESKERFATRAEEAEAIARFLRQESKAQPTPSWRDVYTVGRRGYFTST